MQDGPDRQQSASPGSAPALWPWPWAALDGAQHPVLAHSRPLHVLQAFPLSWLPNCPAR